MCKYYSIEQFLEMRNECKLKVKSIIEEVIKDKKGIIDIEFEKEVYKRIGIMYRTSTDDHKKIIDDVVKDVKCMISNFKNN